MILPILAYGNPVLKKKAKNISNDFINLNEFIENMWETMNNANGVGLAAPQVGLSFRIFIVDTSPFADSESMNKDEFELVSSFKKVFINPVIINETGNKWDFNEGCLSIPEVRADVKRPETILIKYFDEEFNQHQHYFNGIIARVVQHEYDHIEGVLFTDKISPLKRKLLKGKLIDISKGKIKTDYKMKFSKLIKNK
ncbi:MAG: peptide deformylase [Candidatus Marivariicella framensis]|jgi:peptide deformylase|tara:strand:+ start:270 stop:860 length:591 start_codon:yes stop_codon:yes gene_type:complete